MTMTIKSAADIEGMRVAGRLASEVLDLLTPHLKPGVATFRNGYGYQTWIIGAEGRFALLGVRGQAVFVDPATRTVIVHTAVHAQATGQERAPQFQFFFAIRAGVYAKKSFSERLLK